MNNKININTFRNILKNTVKPDSNHVLLINPYEPDGCVISYLPEMDWLQGGNYVFALDAIKEIEVHNGHYMLKVVYDVDGAGNLTHSTYHLYVTTVISPEDL